MFLLSKFSIFYVLSVFHNKQVENQTCNIFLVFFITKKKKGSQTKNTYNTIFFVLLNLLLLYEFSIFYILSVFHNKQIENQTCNMFLVFFITKKMESNLKHIEHYLGVL